jgi:hypothetical protein
MNAACTIIGVNDVSNWAPRILQRVLERKRLFHLVFD